MWLRWQSTSALSQWYEHRFGSGNKRARKVGIVALARKLLIALWRYVEHGELPAGGRGEGLASARVFDGASTREGRVGVLGVGVGVTVLRGSRSSHTKQKRSRALAALIAA